MAYLYWWFEGEIDRFEAHTFACTFVVDSTSSSFSRNDSRRMQHCMRYATRMSKPHQQVPQKVAQADKLKE